MGPGCDLHPGSPPGTPRAKLPEGPGGGSDPLQDAAVNRLPLSHELVLVVRAHPFPGRLDRLQDIPKPIEDLEDRLEVPVVVGGEPEPAPGLEDPLGLGEKGVVEEPPLVMPFLRPRVGEVDVNRPDRRAGEEELDELPGVAVDEAEVRAAPAQGPGVGRGGGTSPPAPRRCSSPRGAAGPRRGGKRPLPIPSSSPRRDGDCRTATPGRERGPDRSPRRAR